MQYKKPLALSTHRAPILIAIGASPKKKQEISGYSPFSFSFFVDMVAKDAYKGEIDFMKIISILKLAARGGSSAPMPNVAGAYEGA
jgi:hypothetical protein